MSMFTQILLQEKAGFFANCSQKHCQRVLKCRLTSESALKKLGPKVSNRFGSIISVHLFGFLNRCSLTSEDFAIAIEIQPASALVGYDNFRMRFYIQKDVLHSNAVDLCLSGMVTRYMMICEFWWLRYIVLKCIQMMRLVVGSNDPLVGGFNPFEEH